MQFSKSKYLLAVLCSLSAYADNAKTEAEKASVKLEDFVVSASPFRRNQVDLAQSTTVLGAQDLANKLQASLGDTLNGEPGITSTSFGPGASRPIIRGLGGDRIRILQDSVGTLDASIISPDHAVSLDPMLVERVEVVRGPASLLFGSSAVGGVVNVITHRIDLEAKDHDIEGSAALRLGGAADEVSRAANTDLTFFRKGATSIILHLDGLRRDTEDLSIPGYALSAAKRAEESQEAQKHGEAAPVFESGTLGNSSVHTEEASVGVSVVTPKLAIGLSRSGHNSIYGVPEQETEQASESSETATGVVIHLRQRRWDYQGELRNLEGLFNTIRFKGAVTRYQHQEIEDGSLGTRFDNQGSETRVEALHGKPADMLEGALGIQTQRSELKAEGDEAFIPPSHTRNLAAFLFEETKGRNLRWQFGARAENQKIRVQTLGTDRGDSLLSGSLGLVWTLSERYSLAWSASRTERGPNAQELYANGPHAGTQAYEIGDASLNKERSHGSELSLRRRNGRITGEFTLFVNGFDGYIFERPTGEQAFDTANGWETRIPLPSDEGGMPVYRYSARTALFYGAEFETLIHLHEEGSHKLDLRLGGDFVRARENGAELPRTPPLRGLFGLRWSHGDWNAGLDSQYVFRQNHVAANESETPSYTLLGANLGYRLSTGRLETQLHLIASNLLDREVRLHSSFLKDIAPLGGRAFSAAISIAY